MIEARAIEGLADDGLVLTSSAWMVAVSTTIPAGSPRAALLEVGAEWTGGGDTRTLGVVAATIHDPLGPWNGRLVACLCADRHVVPLRPWLRGRGDDDPSFNCPQTLAAMPTSISSALPRAGIEAVRLGYRICAAAASIEGAVACRAPRAWMSSLQSPWQCGWAAAALREAVGPAASWAAAHIETVATACPPEQGEGPRPPRPTLMWGDWPAAWVSAQVGAGTWTPAAVIGDADASTDILVIASPACVAWAEARGRAGQDQLAISMIAPGRGRRQP